MRISTLFRTVRQVYFLLPLLSLLTLAGCNAGVNQATNFSIGGTISGLNGTVVLQNNGFDNVSVSTNGTFTFPTPIITGGTYSVTVLTQPAGQICLVGNGSGTLTNSNVNGITVTCSTGGTFSGSFSIPLITGYNASSVLTTFGTDSGSFNGSYYLSGGSLQVFILTFSTSFGTFNGTYLIFSGSNAAFAGGLISNSGSVIEVQDQASGHLICTFVGGANSGTTVGTATETYTRYGNTGIGTGTCTITVM